MANDIDNSQTAYYPYDPSKAAAIIFAIAYGLSALLHELQYRTSRPQQFTIPLTLGAIFSTIGWRCRALNIFDVGDQDTTFLVSSMFILGAGPTYAGADYFVCGRLFAYIPSIAPMSPLRLVRTFIFFDFLAEILVWVGASQAGSAVGSNDNGHGTQGQIGTNLLCVAMLLQAVLFVTFMGVLTVFAARFRLLRARWTKASGPASTAAKKIIFTLAISSVLIIIRSVYDAIDNFIPNTSSFHNSELPVLILEGLVMFLNVALFNLLHPGHILPTNPRLLINSVGEEQVSERTGSALNDNRPVYEKVLDPLDIRGLFGKQKRRDEVLLNGGQGLRMGGSPGDSE